MKRAKKNIAVYKEGYVPPDWNCELEQNKGQKKDDCYRLGLVLTAIMKEYEIEHKKNADYSKYVEICHGLTTLDPKKRMTIEQAYEKLFPRSMIEKVKNIFGVSHEEKRNFHDLGEVKDPMRWTLDAPQVFMMLPPKIKVVYEWALRVQNLDEKLDYSKRESRDRVIAETHCLLKYIKEAYDEVLDKKPVNKAFEDFLLNLQSKTHRYMAPYIIFNLYEDESAGESKVLQQLKEQVSNAIKKYADKNKLAKEKLAKEKDESGCMKCLVRVGRLFFGGLDVNDMPYANELMLMLEKAKSVAEVLHIVHKHLTTGKGSNGSASFKGILAEHVEMYLGVPISVLDSYLQEQFKLIDSARLYR